MKMGLKAAFTTIPEIAKPKIAKVIGEFKAGTLNSGKKGPIVKSKKQAIAIALSSARRMKMKGLK